MSIERKYRKRLNRNGWMAKLQRFVWGSKTPDFMGYCPFFWFTWLSLLVSPLKIVAIIIIVPVALLVLAISHLVKKMPKKIHKPGYTVMLKLAENWREDEGAFLKWLPDSEYQKEWEWLKSTADWRNCFLAALAKKERKEQEKAAADTRDKKRLQSLANKLHYIVKPLVWISGLSLVAVFVFYAVKFILWAWPLIAWPKVGEVLLGIVLIAGGALLIVGFIIGVEWLWNKLRKGCPDNPNKRGFWSTLGSYLWVPFSFLGETIDAIYTRECPLIVWEDDSGPIEYNE